MTCTRMAEMVKVQSLGGMESHPGPQRARVKWKPRITVDCFRPGFTRGLPDFDIRSGRTSVCKHPASGHSTGAGTAPLQTPAVRPVMAGSDRGLRRYTSQKPRAVRVQ